MAFAKKCLLSMSLIGRYRTIVRLYSTVEARDVFEAIKEGNLEKVRNYQSLAEKENFDIRDRQGWSPLHHAVKFGHFSIVQHLISSGANVGLKTYAGQNALDLAYFWKQHQIIEYLHSADSAIPEPSNVFFTESPLERHAEKRSDDHWLFSALGNPKTKFILMYKSQPVVVETINKSGRSKMKLLECSILETHNMLQENRQNLIFLGIFEGSDLSEKTSPNGFTDKDSNQVDSGTAWFAIDVSHMDLKDIVSINDKATVLSVYPGVLQMPASDATVVAQARSLTDWHFRYKFCPTCGSKTSLSESGYKRICQNSTCLSHSGLFNTNYPRVDPTVITAVLSPNKDYCLLARKKSFPPGMFTCVAGFVEPGESIEGACAREINEEVGVKVSRVDYIASQPWPMPSVLMLGCHAHAETQSEIKLDEEELEEARWFSREEIVQMITHSHKDRLFVPPHQAIAHQIIKTWLLRSV